MANTVTISAGQDWTINLDWGTTDIDGYKFYATIKRDSAQADAAAAATKNVTVSGTAYEVDLTFTGATTASLFGSYYFDVKVVDPSGNKCIIPPTGPDILVVVNPATIRSS
jgi:hypothetical protein